MKALALVFKSGVTVKADKVTDWSVGTLQDGSIASLSISQDDSAMNKLIVRSINLSSLDCILEMPSECINPTASLADIPGY